MSSARSIKTLGLAGLMTAAALLALSALGAASAWSVVLPAFLTSVFPVKFTSESLSGQTPILRGLDASKVLHEISCEKSKDTGEIKGEHEVLNVTVEYTKCKELKPHTNECKTSGDASGVILTKLLKGEPGYIEKATKHTGIAFTPETSPEPFAEFNCGVALLKVTGCTIGLVTPINTLVLEMLLLWEEAASKDGQAATSIELLGKTVTCELGTFGGSTWLVDHEIIHLTADVELMA